MKRASGILLPIASLPSKYGIGCFSNYGSPFGKGTDASRETRKKVCLYSGILSMEVFQSLRKSAFSTFRL